MNAPSLDIKNMLESYGESSGTGLVFGSNLFIGNEPSTPDDCVTIYDTGSFPSALGVNYKGYDYPTISIIVRYNDYNEGWNMANLIKDVLHGKNHEVWGGSLYTVITCSGDPTFLEYDDNSRATFSINFNLQRR